MAAKLSLEQIILAASETVPDENETENTKLGLLSICFVANFLLAFAKNCSKFCSFHYCDNGTVSLTKDVRTLTQNLFTGDS